MHIKTQKQLELLGFLELVWASKIICGKELRAALSASGSRELCQHSVKYHYLSQRELLVPG